MRPRIYLLLTLLLAPLCSWGQATVITMANNLRRTVTLEPGVIYKIQDAGGPADYPIDCTSTLILQANGGRHIRIAGYVKTEEGSDRLTITDAAMPLNPTIYEGYDYVNYESLNSQVTLLFTSDGIISYEGYELMAYAVCADEPQVEASSLRSVAPRTATLEWDDPSGAYEWTVLYGTSPYNLTSSVSSETHSATLTNLNPATTYHYRIANNDRDDPSRPACLHQGQFTTPCETAGEIVHDISQGNVVINGNDPCAVHVITGSTDQNRVVVSQGYRGTLVLRNFESRQSGRPLSPIRIRGRSNNPSNFNPATEVNLVLEGYNLIECSGSRCACIQVDISATVHISAIDPQNDYSGTLCAYHTGEEGGAAIGSLNISPSDEVQGFSYTDPDHGVATAGGNVDITSGVLYLHGGHGAGIGGGHLSFYDGMVLVRGGIVHCSASFHAAGIGSGCPTSVGVVDRCTPLSAIMALPPTQIIATGIREAGPDPNLGLAGSRSIFYVGDPNKPLITLAVGDSSAGADIYADLSQDPSLRRTLYLLAPDLDPHRIYLGTTDATGCLAIHASLPNSTTFYTDALTPAGLPYEPVTVEGFTSGGGIGLPVATQSFSVEADTAADLLEGFSQSEALATAARFVVSNLSGGSITGIQFALATAKQYGPLAFFTPAGAPLATAPRQLAAGESVVVRAPLTPGAHPGLHSNLLHITGSHSGATDEVDLRLGVSQYVIRCHRIDICDSSVTSYTLPDGHTITHDTFFLTHVERPTSSTSRHFSCLDDTIALVTNHRSLHDSLEAYRVRFAPLLTDTLARVACDSLSWNGMRLTAPGLYSTPVLRSAAGCDSVCSLRLTLNYSPTLRDTLTLCTAALPYTYHDRTYTTDSASGLHPYRFANDQGCDSLYLLLLNIVDRPSVSIAAPRPLCSIHAYELTAVHQGDAIAWSSTPPDPTLQGQEHQNPIRVAPQQPTLYTATSFLGDLCDSSASRRLEPHSSDLQALIGLDPPHATTQRTEIRLLDRSQGHVDSRLWLVDGEPYATEPVVVYHYPIALDSVPLTLIVADGTDFPCLDTAHATLRLLAEGVLWVPNAFTPDENTNQRFLAKGNNLRDFELAIYDRLGRRVYYTVDPAEGWDGTFRGQPLPQAAYTYLITYTTLDRPRDPQTLTGTVTLIR